MSDPNQANASAAGRRNDEAVQACPLAADKNHWVEIELVGEDDRPIPWEAYEITLPGGNTVSGFLDAQGKARVESPDGGSCEISFPELDSEAWDWYSASTQANGAAK